MVKWDMQANPPKRKGPAMAIRNPQEQAAEVIRLADAIDGCIVTTKVGYDGMATVFIPFEPGDSRAYVQAESDALRILGQFDAVGPGSTWGTDSGSIGGHVGLTGGYVRMNRSGLSKKQIAAYVKMLEV